MGSGRKQQGDGGGQAAHDRGEASRSGPIDGQPQKRLKTERQRMVEHQDPDKRIGREGVARGHAEDRSGQLASTTIWAVP